MEKITYEDMFALLDEIEYGIKDKTRSLNNIDNLTVKKILTNESKIALKSRVTDSIIASGTSIAASTLLVGTLSGAGTGIVTSGLTTLGATSLSMAAGAATGATAGSVVPVAGTIVGAVVGIAAGMFVGNRIAKKNEEKKEQLKQKVLEKQNKIIRELKRELEELKIKCGTILEQNERYRYIISLLLATEEMRSYFNLGV